MRIASDTNRWKTWFRLVGLPKFQWNGLFVDGSLIEPFILLNILQINVYTLSQRPLIFGVFQEK